MKTTFHRLLAAASLALLACGGGGSEPGPDATSDGLPAALSQCMRDHDVEASPVATVRELAEAIAVVELACSPGADDRDQLVAILGRDL